MLDNVGQYLNWQTIAGTVIALSPVTSYLDTVVSIYRSKSSAGFSVDVCGIMLIASICKTYFYVAAPYETSLFVQTLLMIAMQVVLLKVSLTYRPRQWAHGPLDKPSSTSEARTTHKSVQWLLGDAILRGSSNSSMRPLAFWEWDEEVPYWTFLARFSVLLAVCQLLFGRLPAYTTVLGLSGLLIESILPLPQILTINARGSVDGFRPSLLLSWLVGDVCKLVFLCTAADVTWMFIVCGLIQSLLDAYIGVQFYMYSTGKWQAATKQQKVLVSRQRAQSLKMQGVPPS